MNKTIGVQVIAHIETDFKTKFGIPRQSGVVGRSRGRIVFEREFRNPDSLRGLEGFSHLWLLWLFSENGERQSWSPTVRPPRLGGNQRMGVFATRSPFRPNPIGLSSVRLVGVERTESLGDVLVVEGADLMDGTPIVDIKPYLPFTDSHPDASEGYTAVTRLAAGLDVILPEEVRTELGEYHASVLSEILEGDPRPHYHDDGRVYSFEYARWRVSFCVEKGRACRVRTERLEG